MHSGLPRENIYGHTKKLQFIISKLDAFLEKWPKPIKVLDFGCGNGNAVARYLINKDIFYYGVDIHQDSLAYARKNFGKETCQFLDHVPRDMNFDIIIYADVLEHLYDPISLLREHYNILKDDGLVIGAVPNGYGPFENEKRLDKWLRLTEGLYLASRIKRRFSKTEKREGDSTPYNAESGHVVFFTKTSLYSTFENAGFKISFFANGVFCGAPLSERIFLRGNFITKLNARVGDFLPYWSVSTWYFTAQKQSTFL